MTGIMWHGQALHYFLDKKVSIVGPRTAVLVVGMMLLVFLSHVVGVFTKGRVQRQVAGKSMEHQSSLNAFHAGILHVRESEVSAYRKYFCFTWKAGSCLAGPYHSEYFQWFPKVTTCIAYVYTSWRTLTSLHGEWIPVVVAIYIYI